MPPVQAFYSYARLAALWDGVQAKTIQVWVGQLRKTHPHLVYVTYRLARGHRRTAYVSAMTAHALQARHFPNNAMPAKRRGVPRADLPGFLTRRKPDLQPVTPPGPPPAPTPVEAPSAPATTIRKLRLPAMPSRYAQTVKARTP